MGTAHKRKTLQALSALLEQQNSSWLLTPLEKPPENRSTVLHFYFLLNGEREQYTFLECSLVFGVNPAGQLPSSVRYSAPQACVGQDLACKVRAATPSWFRVSAD